MTDSQWQGPFFFIQMADPQFGMFSNDAGFEEETELFTRAVEHANRLKPGFVVICGDLINLPYDMDQTNEFKRIARQLDSSIPLYLASGNHDLGQPNADHTPTQEHLDWYRKTFGADWYGFDHGGCRFAVLNSTSIFNRERFEDEVSRQKEGLVEALKEASSSTHRVVFQHHPWFLREPDEDDGYFAIQSATRREYLDLLERHEVSATFAGHYHENSYGEHGGIEMVTSGPVGMPLGDDPSGFRIVKVYEDRLEHDYYGFDDVPQSVGL